MKLFWQWLIVAQLGMNLLLCLYTDFNGRKVKAPGGFPGAVLTLILMTLIAMLYRAAGAFSEIW